MNILLIILCFYILLFIILFIIMASKIRKLSVQPRNKVRFYVKMIEGGMPWLFIQKKNGGLDYVARIDNFTDFGLNPLDFYNMKEDEVREVFLNIKD